MKKLMIAGCMTVMTVGLVTAKSLDPADCIFCGYGSLPELEEEPLPTQTEGCLFCGSSSTGGTSSGKWDSGSSWSKATSKSVYVEQDGQSVGTMKVSTSKYSTKKGTVSVKAVVTLSNKKKYTAKEKAFTPDADGVIKADWADVSKLGAVSLTITPEGEITGLVGPYEVSDTYSGGSDDDEVFSHGEHMFSVEMDDYTLNEKYSLIDETIPMDIPVVTSDSKKWNCGKSSKVSYKKIKEDGETYYELKGLPEEDEDGRYTNCSSLKLTFNKKKGTFSGSFKVYATNEMSIEKGKPKLKSYTFKISGTLSGSTGIGTAKCSSLKATWTVVID